MSRMASVALRVRHHINQVANLATEQQVMEINWIQTS